MDQFVWHLFSFCRQNELIKNGDKILLSVSGGSDSVALAHIFSEFRSKLSLFPEIIHFHHGIRKESDEEERFVVDLGKTLNLKVHVENSLTFTKKHGLQKKARTWRYECLTQYQKNMCLDSIALGHHENDLLETQLWKICRGISLFNMHPMRLKTEKIIRPLLYTPKQDLLRYLTRHGFSWREDPSNAQNNYTRNKIRNQIIPLLEEHAGEGLTTKMRRLGQDALLLEKAYFSATKHLVLSEFLLYRDINMLPELFAREHLHRFIMSRQVPSISRNQIEKIYRLILQNKGGWSFCFVDNFKIFGSQGRCFIKKI